jgi:hypothetical protein
MEHPNIRAPRTSYLRCIQKYRNEGCPVLYVDETYIHGLHTKPFGWSDDTLHCLLAPVSKGQRLIIVNSGGEQGFVYNIKVTPKNRRLITVT